jgi:hypothetical protein
MADPLHPSVTEFTELAQAYTVVPVWREVLADLETPVSVFLKLVGAGEGFLLESVEHGERWGRYSFVGRDPALTLIARGGAVSWLEGESDPDPGGVGLAAGLPDDRGALGALEALLARAIRVRAGSRPTKEYRPHRSPCSTDSRRNPSPAPTILRNIDTGVSRSASTSRHTGTTV